MQIAEHAQRTVQSHPVGDAESAWHRIYDLLFKYTRGKRMANFEKHAGLTGRELILDVGGDTSYWYLTQTRPKVRLLNLNIPTDARDDDRFTWEEADATKLPHQTGEFELLFSNSVIEHLGDYEAQKKFASECRRVGRRLWIQTPAMAFPLEPHYLTPFVHWYPKWFRRATLKWFSVWGLMNRPSQARVNRRVDEIRLLTKREMRELFPDCTILVERFCFWPKAYIAVRDDPAESKA